MASTLRFFPHAMNDPSLWFIAQNGSKQGPHSTTRMQELAAAGSLRPTDLVWKYGMPNWVPASSVPELFQAVALQPPPLPSEMIQPPPIPFDGGERDLQNPVDPPERKVDPFRFHSGEQAHDVDALAVLCQRNLNEAQWHIEQGHFEPWLRSIGCDALANQSEQLRRSGQPMKEVLLAFTKACRDTGRRPGNALARSSDGVVDEVVRSCLNDAEEIHGLFRVGKDINQRLSEMAASRIHTWRRGADRDVGEAQWLLGMCLDRGVATSENLAEAARLFQKAADIGLPQAQVMLGLLHQFGRGVPESLQEAMGWYWRSAEMGYAPAEWLLGSCCRSGKQVPQDLAEAARWYRKAAEHGHLSAQIALGFLYIDGLGLPRNEGEGLRWIRQAAQQGDINAIHCLISRHKRNDPTEELCWCRKGAELGDVESLTTLGFLYYHGSSEHRIGQDFSQAFYWLKQAAEKNDASAQKTVGELYLRGQGVGCDPKEGARWIRKAAEQGFCVAQYILGRLYCDGEGVPKDEATGLSWLRKSAAQDYSAAKDYIAERTRPSIWKSLFGG